MDAPTSSATETTTAPREPNLVGVSQPKAIIKNVDMSEEMQQESVDIASAALEKYNIEKDIAAQIKKEFDRRHGPTWHVVVGKNSGVMLHMVGPWFYLFFFSFSLSAHKTRVFGKPNHDLLLFLVYRLKMLIFLSFCSSHTQKPNTSSTSTSAPLPSSSGNHEQASYHPCLELGPEMWTFTFLG
jgi:dynein light chain LC8-type